MILQSPEEFNLEAGVGRSGFYTQLAPGQPRGRPSLQTIHAPCQLGLQDQPLAGWGVGGGRWPPPTNCSASYPGASPHCLAEDQELREGLWLWASI